MDRYQIAKGYREKKKIYTWKPSKSIYQIKLYLEKCITEGAIFNATDFEESILLSALIEIAKKYLNIPILVKNKELAYVLSISTGYPLFCTSEDLIGPFFIMHWETDKEPVGKKALLKIIVDNNQKI